MKPKYRRLHAEVPQPARQPQLHTMEFTAETLMVLEASFETMEEVFKRSSSISHPLLPFALETFKQVKQKVFDMLRAPGTVFEFDWNEVLIVRTCLQIYAIDLMCMQATAERDHHITVCEQVVALLPKELPLSIRLHD